MGTACPPWMGSGGQSEALVPLCLGCVRLAMVPGCRGPFQLELCKQCSMDVCAACVRLVVIPSFPGRLTPAAQAQLCALWGSDEDLRLASSRTPVAVAVERSTALTWLAAFECCFYREKDFWVLPSGLPCCDQLCCPQWVLLGAPASAWSTRSRVHSGTGVTTAGRPAGPLPSRLGP